MTLVLGIHCGHEASCAIAEDGVVLAAIQQERTTRVKYDGQETLSPKLPIDEVLRLSGVRLPDIEYIVSSFQAAGPGAVGLQRPLVSKDFNFFDPFDDRHWTVSHHLAHAASTAFQSGYDACAVLVSDSAGSTTLDGDDFVLSFRDFYTKYAELQSVGKVFTEKRSFYDFNNGELRLKSRDFVVPHNQPDVYVQSESSLYDNMSRFVFRQEHAHGQFMALATLSDRDEAEGRGSVERHDILRVDLSDGAKSIMVKNGWQQHIPAYPEVMDFRDEAAVIQSVFTELVQHEASKALRLTGREKIALAGGVFLNLDANSRIAELVGRENVYVPSAPHDAGISVGCALLGSSWDGKVRSLVQSPSDFLGLYPEVDVDVAPYVQPVSLTGTSLARRVAEALLGGDAVIRFCDRAEFGPRALGNRSILASPVGAATMRNKLNTVKGRQKWRPVSPMVREEDFNQYFDGPIPSYFMGRAHRIKKEYRELLHQVSHGEGTARVQTVPNIEEFQEIRAILFELAALAAPPVLMNTSLNGPGQPIINRWSDVLEFARRSEIRYIATSDRFYEIVPSSKRFKLKEGCYFVSSAQQPAHAIVFYDGRSKRVSAPAARKLVKTVEHDCSDYSLEDIEVLRNLGCVCES